MAKTTDAKQDKCIAGVAKKELQKSGMTIKKATAIAKATCATTDKKETKKKTK